MVLGKWTGVSWFWCLVQDLGKHSVAGRINEVISIKRLQYQAHNKHSPHVSCDYFSSVADIWPLTEWVLNKWALNKLTIAWMLWEHLLSGQFLPLLIFVFLSASPKLGYILNFFLWHHTIVFIIVITKTFLNALYHLNLKLSHHCFQQVCILKYTFQIFLR